MDVTFPGPPSQVLPRSWAIGGADTRGARSGKPSAAVAEEREAATSQMVARELAARIRKGSRVPFSGEA